MSCPFEDLITIARSLKFQYRRDCGESRTLINKGLDLAGMGVDIDGKRFNLNFLLPSNQPFQCWFLQNGNEYFG